MRYAGIQVDHIDEEEFTELHDRIAFCARVCGLNGHALDVAIAGAVASIVQVIERERAMRSKRREALHVV